MGVPVLLIGKSGSGKSASLRNFPPDKLGIVNVIGKPLPFKNTFKPVNTTDYNMVITLLSKAKAKSLVIDDAGYLITNHFMEEHASTGKGNAVFGLYNDLADRFYNLCRFIVNQLPAEKIVYVVMHEEKNDMGDIRPKTIGKLLDEKVCLEGLFTIALRSTVSGGKYVFTTRSSGFDVSKSPIGMFEEAEIDNDLYLVDKAIRDYYGLNEEEQTA